MVKSLVIQHRSLTKNKIENHKILKIGKKKKEEIRLQIKKMNDNIDFAEDHPENLVCLRLNISKKG